MRKFTVATALAFVCMLSACKCGLEKQNVGNVDTSFGMIKVDYIAVCKKAGLTDAQVKDRQLLIDSVQHDIDALKAAVK